MTFVFPFQSILVQSQNVNVFEPSSFQGFVMAVTTNWQSSFPTTLSQSLNWSFTSIIIH